MFLECLECGGRYQDPQPDGLRYYHVCAPIVIVTVERAGARIEIPRRELAAGDKPIGFRLAPRSNGRNENSPREWDNERKRRRKAGGAVEIDPPAPALEPFASASEAR